MAAWCRARRGHAARRPLSPLLANVLLDEVDKELGAAGPSLRALRRRLQRVRAQPEGGGAGDGAAQAAV